MLFKALAEPLRRRAGPCSRFNYPSPDNCILFIEHRCLTGTDAGNGLVECDTDAAWSCGLDHRRHEGRAVAYLYEDVQGSFQLFEGDEVRLRHCGLFCLELGKLSENDPALFRLDPGDVEPFSCGDAELSSLSHGEEGDAVVLAHDLSAGHDDLSGFEDLGCMVLQKCAVVVVRDEADLLALGPLRSREVERPCLFAHFCFFHPAQWKEHVRELVLGQAVQEVALVFAGVGAFLQEKTVCCRIVFDTGIVAGGEKVETIFAGEGQKQMKLDEVVALDAGVRRAAVTVFGDEVFDNIPGKGLLYVDHAMGNVEVAADGLGRGNVAAKP